MKIADAKIRVPTATPGATRTRRTYARQFKREVVEQCLVPGASVSAIALSHGINANVIRKWLPESRPTTMLPVTVESAPLAATPPPGTPATRGAARSPIELTLAGATVRVPVGFDPHELRTILQILAALR